MDMMTLYWITRLDGIIGGLFMLIVVLFFAGIMGAVITASEAVFVEFRKYIFGCFGLGLIASILLILTPTQKDVAIIYGIHKISNNEEASKLPDNVLKTVNKYLEDLQTE